MQRLHPLRVCTALQVIKKVDCKKQVYGDLVPIDPCEHHYEVQLEESIHLECHTKKGLQLSFQWYFQGHPIPAECDSCYKITCIRDYHDGEYVCQVKQDEEHEEEKSHPICLDIQGEI